MSRIVDVGERPPKVQRVRAAVIFCAVEKESVPTHRSSPTPTAIISKICTKESRAANEGVKAVYITRYQRIRREYKISRWHRGRYARLF